MRRMRLTSILKCPVVIMSRNRLASMLVGGIVFILALQGILAGIRHHWISEPAGPRHTKYDADIRHTARRHMPAGWDWRLFKAMIHQESGFDRSVISSRGAVGLGQIMPATGKEMGYSRRNLLQWDRNLSASAEYLREQWSRWEGVPDMPPDWQRTRLALASYNAGPYRVKKAVRRVGDRDWQKVKSVLPGETRHYVRRIVDELYPAYRRLHFGFAVGVMTDDT